MAARTACVDRNEEITSLSPYVLVTGITRGCYPRDFLLPRHAVSCSALAACVIGDCIVVLCYQPHSAVWS